MFKIRGLKKGLFALACAAMLTGNLGANAMAQENVTVKSGDIFNIMPRVASTTGVVSDANASANCSLTKEPYNAIATISRISGNGKMTANLMVEVKTSSDIRETYTNTSSTIETNYTSTSISTKYVITTVLGSYTIGASSTSFLAL